MCLYTLSEVHYAERSPIFLSAFDITLRKYYFRWLCQSLDSRELQVVKLSL